MKYTRYHRYREIIKITGSQIQRQEGEKLNAMMSYEPSLD